MHFDFHIQVFDSGIFVQLIIFLQAISSFMHSHLSFKSASSSSLYLFTHQQYSHPLTLRGGFSFSTPHLTPHNFQIPKRNLPAGVTAVAQWLRCCATNRKVAGSIPASVSGFFVDTKPFRSHYGPGVDSAPNRNEYQEYFLGVKAAGA